MKKRKTSSRRPKGNASSDHSAFFFWAKILGAVAVVIAVSVTILYFQHRDPLWVKKIEQDIANTSARRGMVVRDIYIIGRRDLSHAQILQQIDIDRGTAMLNVDTKKIREQIQALPPVAHANVRRAWPDRLVIRIEERVPIALWQKNQTLFPIDRDGTVLTYRRAEQLTHLPVLVGKDAPKQAAVLLNALATYPELLAKVRGATYVGDRRWDLHLKSDMVVKLPDGDVRAGIKRLMIFADKHLIFAKPIAAVDLRLEDRTVVTPSPAADTTTPETIPHNEKSEI